MEIAEPDSSFLAELAAVGLVKGGGGLSDRERGHPGKSPHARADWFPTGVPKHVVGLKHISMTVVPVLQHHLYHLRSLLFPSLFHELPVLPLHEHHKLLILNV